MADKITNTNYLDINLGFFDEDTRKIKIPNAITAGNMTTQMFENLNDALKPTISGSAVSFVVGDRTGAEFTGILNADRVTEKTTNYDITN